MYLTVAELRSLRPQITTAVASDDQVQACIDEISEIAEDYRGCLFEDQSQTDYPGVVYTTPPKRLIRAITEYVVSTVANQASGHTRDVISQSIDGSMVRYSTPNWAEGRPTGYLEVDRLLNSLPDYRVIGVG